MSEQMEELQELSEIMEESSTRKSRGVSISGNAKSISDDWDGPVETEADGHYREPGGMIQWSMQNGKIFIPAGETRPKLTPGVYEVNNSPNYGIYFEKISINTGNIIRFPDTNADKVLGEIQKFWEREDKFIKHNLIHKRGILLWGPPGSGKSCLIKLITNDIVDRGGIVINFTTPGLLIEGMRILRQIQPDLPVVVMMEDLDSIIEYHVESEVLNILDGINRVDKIVFVATTNYPDRLGARIVNRPSRFDKRFKIGMPNEESRRLYFTHLFSTLDDPEKYDLDRWVADTQKMSVAHLHELFVAVEVLEDDYESAVYTLQNMKDVIKDSSGMMAGFAVNGHG